jgi:hypothetical protein
MYCIHNDVYIFITMFCNYSFIAVCSTIELNGKHNTLVEGKHPTKILNFCRGRETALFFYRHKETVMF